MPEDSSLAERCAAPLLAALRKAGAARLSHAGGRQLLEHLQGTWTVLRQWGQGPRLCRAGLFHSCYSTYAYPHRLFKLEARDTVRKLIGAESERIAYHFCTIDRARLVAAFLAAGSVPQDGLRAEDFRTHRPELLPKELAIDLLVLHLANLAEQPSGADGRPSRWLSRFSQLGRLLRPHLEIRPAMLDGLRGAIAPRDEQLSARHYFAGLRLLAEDLESARQHFELAALHNAWIAEPRIGAALCELLLQNWRGTESQAQAGFATCQDWGTAWDKRRSWHHWLALAEWLGWLAAESARRPQWADRWHSACASAIAAEPFRYVGSRFDFLTGESLRSQPLQPAGSAGHASRSNSAGANRDAGWRRFQVFIRRFLGNEDRPQMNRYPGLTAKPWHDPASFRAATLLEAAYPRVKREFLALRGRGGFQPEMEAIKRTGAWNVFMLYERGRKNLENCAQCPETTRIIESSSSLRTHLGLIYFSVMSPHTHVQAHTGPTNLRVRCHLGLEIPPDCGLRVGPATRTWQEGKCLVFDDFFEHEAWNQSDRNRSVLIVDLWHPDLTPVEIQALEGLNRHVQHQASGLSRYWRRNQEGRQQFSEDKRWL